MIAGELIHDCGSSPTIFGSFSRGQNAIPPLAVPGTPEAGDHWQMEPVTGSDVRIPGWATCNRICCFSGAVRTLNRDSNNQTSTTFIFKTLAYQMYQRAHMGKLISNQLPWTQRGTLCLVLNHRLPGCTHGSIAFRRAGWTWPSGFLGDASAALSSSWSQHFNWRTTGSHDWNVEYQRQNIQYCSDQNYYIQYF